MPRQFSITVRNTEIFWLTVLEISIHGGLALLLLGLCQGSISWGKLLTSEMTVCKRGMEREREREREREKSHSPNILFTAMPPLT
jgi:hypothetical protein